MRTAVGEWGASIAQQKRRGGRGKGARGGAALFTRTEGLRCAAHASLSRREAINILYRVIRSKYRERPVGSMMTLIEGVERTSQSGGVCEPWRLKDRRHRAA